MPNKNKFLHPSKAEKNDEFYTLMEDIKNELSQYDFSQFKNKVVYCNCDDPTWSNFFKFFTEWGEKMGIKEAHFTNYANGKRQFKQLTLFKPNDLKESAEDDKKGTAHHWIYTPKTDKTIKKELKGDGDFSSKECLSILCKSDIIITNPPFSLLRKFVNIVAEEYKKKILIIGGQNAISYKEIFKLIKENKLWLGNTHHLSGIINSNGKKIFSKESDGALPRACCWFTNLEVGGRQKPLVLHPQDLSTYSKYDNYDAIEIPETKLIPDNYYKEMGVPITFLQKYCPEQFEIVGQMVTTKIDEYNFGYPYINGKKKFARILIKRKGERK